MKYFSLIVLAALWLLQPCQAQESSYEKQLVTFADGEEIQFWISMDDQSDLLHCKPSEDAKPEAYQASEVVSFRYQGNLYYSLPLRDGYFTFFKVQHEGGEFAVLEKAPSFKALRIIADDSNGRLSMCQNRGDKQFTLCFRDGSDRTYHSAISNRAPGVPSGFRTQQLPKTIVREFEVEKLVYLAIEGQLRLFYMQTDERYNFWDNWIGPRPGKYRVEHMLEDFIQDQIKMDAIQKKIKKDKLDIRKTEDLIQALGAVYH